MEKGDKPKSVDYANGMQNEHAPVNTTEKNTQELTPVERKEEGEKLLKDLIESTNLYMRLCSGSVQAFTRDFRYFKREVFEDIAPLTNGASYKDLGDKLVETAELFKNEIEIPELSSKDIARAHRILEGIYKDLNDVISAFSNFLNILKRDERFFSEFNGKNIEVDGYAKSNIEYDIDGLNTAIVTSKDIIEAALRLSISVYGEMDKLEKRQAA